jgi:hypothetical protein
MLSRITIARDDLDRVIALDEQRQPGAAADCSPRDRTVASPIGAAVLLPRRSSHYVDAHAAVFRDCNRTKGATHACLAR